VKAQTRATAGFSIAVAVVVLVVAYQRLAAPPHRPAPTPTEAPSRHLDQRRTESSGDEAIREAFSARRSGVWVESSGTVERLLADDEHGSRHQRFIVRLRDGRTLLFAHNIDLASRVPLQPGSGIRFRGRYEWSERGGTVHWTHHDPDGNQAGGWIEYEGRQYR
jgi:Protein of unknown function (DUF3465)